MLRFANPELLWLLLLNAALTLLWFWRKRRAPAAVLPTVARFRQLKPSLRAQLLPLLLVLRVAAFSLLIIALARPQASDRLEVISAETVDIMLALDISTSMGSEDFQPRNRLEVAKAVISDFIAGRTSDRIGLVAFAGFSFLKCPLTTDYKLLSFLLESTKMTEPENDGTAIGMALANAVNHLRASGAKSRVIILLTDGENNVSTIEPATGAELARAMGIKVYAVGVGREAKPVGAGDQPGPPNPAQQPASINEDSLKQIAQITGGSYFRATDSDSLRRIFQEIDKLEKTEIDVKRFHRFTELFAPYALSGLLLLLVELLLHHSWLRVLP